MCNHRSIIGRDSITFSFRMRNVRAFADGFLSLFETTIS